MTTRDPLRMAEPGSGEPAELASALRALRAERSSAAQLQALAQRLGAELAEPTVAGSGVVLPLWSKWLIGGLLASAIGLAVVILRPAPETGDSVVARPPQARPVPAPAVRPSPQAQPASALDVDTAARRERPASARATRVPAAQRAAAAAASVPNSPEAELVLLQRSQAALDRNPETALALAEQHARDYPAGVFVQEREILAIEALLKLRRKQAAVERTRRFVAQHPESPHALRARALLGRSHLPGAAAIPDATGHSAAEPEPGGEHAED